MRIGQTSLVPSQSRLSEKGMNEASWGEEASSVCGRAKILSQSKILQLLLRGDTLEHAVVSEGAGVSTICNYPTQRLLLSCWEHVSDLELSLSLFLSPCCYPEARGKLNSVQSEELCLCRPTWQGLTGGPKLRTKDLDASLIPSFPQPKQKRRAAD